MDTIPMRTLAMLGMEEEVTLTVLRIGFSKIQSICASRSIRFAISSVKLTK